MAHLELRASHAARLNRLLSILQRLKWEQGEDGLVRPVSPAEALNDLGLYMLGHEIDMAVERNQAETAPVVPEGWRLVPVEPSEAMKNELLEADWDEAETEDVAARSIYNAIIRCAPPSPLRTEAEVRSEARREALEEAAKAVARMDNGKFDHPETALEHAVEAIRALIEKGPQ